MSDANTALWLKRLRLRAGYATQQAFADAIGVKRSAVGNWEAGIGKPSMSHAETIAVLTKSKRSEVMARLGYPIGGGEPQPDALQALPAEWMGAIRDAVTAGVADGIAQALEELRREGLIASPPGPGAGPRRRQSA